MAAVSSLAIPSSSWTSAATTSSPSALPGTPTSDVRRLCRSYPHPTALDTDSTWAASTFTLRRLHRPPTKRLIFIHNYNHAEMQLLPAQSLLLYGDIAVMLPLAQAQTSTAPAASQNTPQDGRLKLAEEAFRAGSAAYLQNDLQTAHMQFAKLVELAPEVAAGHTAFRNRIACRRRCPFRRNSTSAGA